MELISPRKRRKINVTMCCREYFEEKETRIENGSKKVFFICTVCKKQLNGTKESNLSAHLQKHKEIYEKVCEPDGTIEKKRMKILLDCVELVSINGNAFSRLLDSGLRSMIDQTLNELAEAHRSINLTDPHLYEVKEMLRNTAKQVQEKISDELRDIPLTLMVDITAKRRRSILGVSVQFIKDRKHKIRSIGMLQLHESHTSEYLAKVICDLLQAYKIQPNQVIAITTDKGANVVKMVRGISTRLTENTSSRIIRETESCDAEIENYLQNEPDDYTDDEILATLFQQDDESDDEHVPQATHANLLDAIAQNVQSQNGPFMWHVNGIRCAVHTLQLCIKDALDKLDKPIKNEITMSRRIAKTMRLHSTANQLKSAGIDFTIPHLDVETRWCSTYIMVRKSVFFFLN